MPIATVSEEGWVVIPQEIREKYGLKKGSQVTILDFGGRITLMPVPEGDPIERGFGLLKGGPSMTEALLEDRRLELEHEERRLPSPKPRE
jgi:AbrB family looped-hinge helix DNA binding protein